MKNIIIVEDDKDMVELYKEMLKGKYKLAFVSDTKSAYEKLEKNKYDLMILDIILPKESGDVFFEKIKNNEKYKNIPILVATVLGDVCDYFKTIDKKTECLGKPFEKEQLIERIESIIK